MTRIVPEGWEERRFTPYVPPRKESKATCPHCEREPGGVHPDECPRSRASFARLRLATKIAGLPRPIYPGVGAFSLGGKVGFNPGVPRVKAPKPRTAGGLPVGTVSVVVQHEEKTGVPRSEVIDRTNAARVFLEDFGSLGRS